MPTQLSPEAIPFALSMPRTGQQVESLKNFAFDSAPMGRISETAGRMEADLAGSLPPQGAGTGLARDLWPGVLGGAPPLPLGTSRGDSGPEQ